MFQSQLVKWLLRGAKMLFLHSLRLSFNFSFFIFHFSLNASANNCPARKSVNKRKTGLHTCCSFPFTFCSSSTVRNSCVFFWGLEKLWKKFFKYCKAKVCTNCREFFLIDQFILTSFRLFPSLLSISSYNVVKSWTLIAAFCGINKQQWMCIAHLLGIC